MVEEDFTAPFSAKKGYDCTSFSILASVNISKKVAIYVRQSRYILHKVSVLKKVIKILIQYDLFLC